MSEPASEAEGETITIHELLERSAESALELQREDGSFPPGQNNTYGDKETPVRSTSHWLTTLSRVYEITERERFREAVNEAADYLLRENRPYGYTFRARISSNKDSCNGLVGQECAIRGLYNAGRVLGRQELVEEAVDLFLLHPFDESIGLWEKVEIDGQPRSYDRTLNHQLLFASAGAELFKESNVIRNELEYFLGNLKMFMGTRPNGCIKHYIQLSLRSAFQASFTNIRHWELLLNKMILYYNSISNRMEQKEARYHAVNLWALGILKNNFPSHRIWSEDLIEEIMKYIKSKEYKELCDSVNSPMGNLNGIGNSCALLFIEDEKNMAKSWLSSSIYNNYNFKSDLYELNTVDPVFQSATISRISNFPDIELSNNSSPY